MYLVHTKVNVCA